MYRYLVLKILEAMLERGWHNIAAIDISGEVTDKSVLIFQQREPKRCPMMCLSLNDADKFRLINMPAHLIDIFKQMILSRWSKGIQKEKIMNLSFGSVPQIKLRGSPWNGGVNNDAYHIRSFLCNVMEAFAEQGWTVFMAGDVSAKYIHREKDDDYPVDAHSFWFIYEPTTAQQPNAPSYGFNAATPSFVVAAAQAPYPPLGLHQKCYLGTGCLKQPQRIHLLVSWQGMGCTLTQTSHHPAITKLQDIVRKNNEVLAIRFLLVFNGLHI